MPPHVAAIACMLICTLTSRGFGSQCICCDAGVCPTPPGGTRACCAGPFLLIHPCISSPLPLPDFSPSFLPQTKHEQKPKVAPAVLGVFAAAMVVFAPIANAAEVSQLTGSGDFAGVEAGRSGAWPKLGHLLSNLQTPRHA